MTGSLEFEPAYQGAGDISAAGALGQAEERPGAFAKAFDQAGLGQQPQMTRQPWLRLPQNVGEVGDGQFSLRQQRQDAKPRRFARSLQGRGQSGERQLLVWHCAIPAAIRNEAYLLRG